MPTCLRVALALWLLCWWLQAAVVRVENQFGGINIRVTTAGRVLLDPTSPVRDVRPGDVRVIRQAGLSVIECRPEDGAPIDIDVEIPYGLGLEARTDKGAISVTGLVRTANLVTTSGDLKLTAPWEATRLWIGAGQEPKELIAPKDLNLQLERVARVDQPAVWVLRDRHQGSRVRYGRIRASVTAPGRVEIGNLPFPQDAPVRLHWQAPQILRRLFVRPKQTSLRRRDRPTPPPPAGDAEAQRLTVTGGAVRFSSDVRIVNMPVAVHDAQGRALAGLTAGDFEVYEDGVLQEVTYLDSGDAPFNLTLLLDLSGSTRQDQPAMKTAARRFLDMVGPHDRVALHALANGMLHVVSPLTDDRRMLAALIDVLPKVSGGTPLYDVMVLSYANELRQLPDERNALIVISDGVDNQLDDNRTPSKVSFRRLEKVARELHALIYPILLDPKADGKKVPRWARRARQRMERLAAATGGRLFPARSVQDLEPVYPQVAGELRSVYSLGYRPKNQDFHDAWRAVEVKVKRPAARVRTRQGYFAKR